MSVLSDPEASTHISNPIWLYQAGDTLEEEGLPVIGPIGPAGAEVVCSGGFSCTYEPQQSGRVYLVFDWQYPDLPFTLELMGWSPVLWVRDDDPGPAADSLRLTCNTAILTRGDFLSCTASLDSDGELTLSEWVYEGGGEVIHAGADEGLTWEGPMVVSGTVRARAVVGTGEQTVEQSITVRPRGWPDLPALQTEVRVVKCPASTWDCPLVYPPTHFSHLAGSRGFAERVRLGPFAATVENGPNRGWSYIAGRDSPFDLTMPVVWINAALMDPGDPLYRYLDGRKGRCDVEAVRDNVLAHEEKHIEYFVRRLRAAMPGSFLDGFFSFGHRTEFEEHVRSFEERVFQLLLAEGDPYPGHGEERQIVESLPSLDCSIDFTEAYRRTNGGRN